MKVKGSGKCALVRYGNEVMATRPSQVRSNGCVGNNRAQSWTKLRPACSSQEAFVSLKTPLMLPWGPLLWKEP